VLECVVNVSEGCRADVLRALAAACGGGLLDIHTDPDHNRSVFTLAGRWDDLAAAALRLARAAGEHIDISGHTGVHPRLGAVDVVPFVALAGEERGTAVAVARSWGSQAAETLAVPVFLYGDADPAGRSLPETRRDAFAGRPPDFGPAVPHPRLGAMAVGARPLMVAVNCELDSPDLLQARRIAGQVRERDGGMPGVRALGFGLASKSRAQVSMNLVDLGATGLEAACSEVRRLARAEGTDVAAVELVGLAPEAELARCSPEFLRWSGLGVDQTIAARLRAAGLLDDEDGPDGP
jgi:glutamate formiminotransferase